MTEVGVRAGANGYRVVIMCSAGKPDGKEENKHQPNVSKENGLPNSDSGTFL